MIVRYLGGVAVAALLIGTGCAHSQTAGQNNPSATQPYANAGQNVPGAAGTGDNVTREKDMLMSQADGTQPGRIRSFTGDTITVDNPNAGVSGAMTLKIDSSVPVFQGMQKMGTDSLTPGQDVRVFFKNTADISQPQAIAVVIDVPTSTTPSATPGSNDPGSMGNEGVAPSHQPSAPGSSEPMQNEPSANPENKDANPDNSANPGSSGTTKDPDNMNGNMDNSDPGSGDHATPSGD